MRSVFNHDWDGNGKIDEVDLACDYSVIEHQEKQRKEYNESHPTNWDTVQGGYNIIFCIVVALILIFAPIFTIIGVCMDAKYFFESNECCFFAFLTVVEIILLVVWGIKKYVNKK